MSGMWRYGVEGDGVWCEEGKMIALSENIRNMHIGFSEELSSKNNVLCALNYRRKE